MPTQPANAVARSGLCYDIGAGIITDASAYTGKLLRLGVIILKEKP
ncbi:hypothetical protein [Chloroflexus sp.]|nr:hypothetical protein [Chloroflexus sp.]